MPRTPRSRQRAERGDPQARAELTHVAREPLQRDLCAWFARRQRALPWRATRDPYAIWISEAMLQQTRVETVIPYWRRFLERFPTLDALARASEDDVVAAWSGLGYYRRARALRAAALAIVERHGGRFPRAREQLLELPGIGPYTAGAVLSIAFDLREPLVDGNVVRVFARWFALEQSFERPAELRTLWKLAAELVPAARGSATSPRNWNQALMELGATICSPREPDCPRCPVRQHCRAFLERRTAELPRVVKRAAPIEVRLQMLVVRDGERVLLRRRAADARMASMWELPTRELVPAGAAPRLWPAEFDALRGVRIDADALRTLRHAITVHKLTAALHAARLGGRAALPAECAWFEPRELGRLALTGLARKALRAELEGADEHVHALAAES